MKTHLAVVALTLLGGSAANAQNEGGHFIKGNDLHSLCHADVSIARMYVLGVFDHSNFAAWNDQVENVRLCSADGVTGPQLTDVVCEYLRLNPAHRHIEAAMLTATAIRDAYPCTN